MNVLRPLLLLIFTILSSRSLNSRSISASESFCPQTEISHIEQGLDVCFAARAPSVPSTNIAFAGAAVAERGDGFIMHGHETHVASLGIGVS
ncbi:hypothetical protein [Aliiroseovarius crassostreae]|uniref:hypothetical protein n=1 Tax=Aliiroseovarius crassostreae TaxID=154981 RepID=UPI003C7CF494